MEEFLKFGRLKKECMKIQGAMAPPCPLPPFADPNEAFKYVLDFTSVLGGQKELGSLNLSTTFEF